MHYFLGRASDNEKQRLEGVYGKDLFASIVYGKFEKRKDVMGKDFNPPIKSQLDKDLSTEKIRQVVDAWDLNNPKKSDKLILSKVDKDEQ